MNSLLSPPSFGVTNRTLLRLKIARCLIVGWSLVNLWHIIVVNCITDYTYLFIGLLPSFGSKLCATITSFFRAFIARLVVFVYDWMCFACCWRAWVTTMLCSRICIWNLNVCTFADSSFPAVSCAPAALRYTFAPPSKGTECDNWTIYCFPQSVGSSKCFVIEHSPLFGKVVSVSLLVLQRCQENLVDFTLDA